MYLRSQFEEEYDFFPVTYMLPFDMLAFKREFVKKKPEIEPEAIVVVENQIQIIENKEPNSSSVLEELSVSTTVNLVEASPKPTGPVIVD